MSLRIATAVLIVTAALSAADQTSAFLSVGFASPTASFFGNQLETTVNGAVDIAWGCTSFQRSAAATTVIQASLSGSASSSRGDTSPDDESNGIDDSERLKERHATPIDTSAYRDKRDGILEWLAGLEAPIRSDPEWVGRELLFLSPSEVAQRHLSSLFDLAPNLFPAARDQAKFDWDWRYGLLTLVPPDTLSAVVTEGMSNTHPLRLQAVAIPPGYDFSLHVHPGIEYNIPLVGEVRERRAAGTFLPEEVLRRRAEHRTIAAGGRFLAEPTTDEIQAVTEYLSHRALFEDRGKDGSFIDCVCQEGNVIVNEIGSVHQSYTTPGEGCLLFVLGTNIHAHFLPGNFQQRIGIQQLKGIEHLIKPLSP